MESCKPLETYHYRPRLAREAPADVGWITLCMNIEASYGDLREKAQVTLKVMDVLQKRYGFTCLILTDNVTIKILIKEHYHDNLC